MTQWGLKREEQLSEAWQGFPVSDMMNQEDLYSYFPAVLLQHKVELKQTENIVNM